LGYYFVGTWTNVNLACFSVATGDVEDAPALDPLTKYNLVERDGAVYVKTDEETVKRNRRPLDIRCSATSPDKVLVIGGYVPTNLCISGPS
jgi:hypothetical protein